VIIWPMAVVNLPRPLPGWLPRLLAWLQVALAARVPAAGEDLDPAVLERARVGDHRAFAAIVDRYDRQLRALAYRLLGDRDRMDDVLQEAYVKAFRALPGFRGDAALSTWLHRIVYNACLDDLRRRRHVIPVAGDEQAQEAAWSRPGPAEVVAERQELADALATLPVDQRAAVLLVDAYGFDYGEAAEILAVRTGTIASRLSRARSTLRAALGGVAS